MLQTLYPKHLLNVRDAFKKKTQKETLVHSHSPPTPLAWMGQEELRHQKLFTNPLPSLALGTNFIFLEVSWQTLYDISSSSQQLYYILYKIFIM